MNNQRAYHRPRDLDEALKLLQRPGVSTIILAGGTSLVPKSKTVEADFLDLQLAGLDTISKGGETLSLGSTVRLQTLINDPRTPALIKETALLEGPNTFRNSATIGGVIAGADWESELFAALLVHEAEISIAYPGEARRISLHVFAQDPDAHLSGGIITGVEIQIPGATAFARVARTPADKPIVAAAGRVTPAGEMMLAFCGLGQTPVLLAADHLDEITPPEDFRGSTNYRKAMAKILAGRVSEQLS